MDGALDQMVWDMVLKVSAWRSALAGDVLPRDKERTYAFARTNIPSIS